MSAARRPGPLMDRTNDENAPPEHGPNDADRLRFGFKQRPSQGLRHNASCSAILQSKPQAQQTPRAPPADAAACEVIPLVERFLGDPDVCMPLLRMKSFASKYDFKGRINELSEQNRSLRAAVLEQRENYKALVDALGPVQAKIDWQMRTASSDLAAARQQLEERSRLSEEVQQALRVVMREESAQKDDGRPTYDALQQELEALRKSSSIEAARAERAEARVRDRDALVATLREELEAARSQAAKRRELEALVAALREEAEAARAEARMHQDRAVESTQLAKQQVNEAAQLLSQQVAEAAENHRKMLTVAKQREESLIAELAKMATQSKDLEARLASKATPTAPAFEEPPEAGEAAAESDTESDTAESGAASGC